MMKNQNVNAHRMCFTLKMKLHLKFHKKRTKNERKAATNKIENVTHEKLRTSQGERLATIW